MGLVLTTGTSIMEMSLSSIPTVPAVLAVTIVPMYVCHQVSLAQASSSTVIMAIALSNIVVPGWMGDPQTIRGRGHKDEHWNTLIIIFD